MQNGFELITTPTTDGQIIQELFSVSNGIREQILRELIDTKEQHIKDALIALGWTPPNGSLVSPN